MYKPPISPLFSSLVLYLAGLSTASTDKTSPPFYATETQLLAKPREDPRGLAAASKINK